MEKNTASPDISGDVTAQVVIRPETFKDYPQIKGVIDQAFGRENESTLIEKLRHTGEYLPALSLLAEVSGQVVGYLLLYPVKIMEEDIDFDCLSLGPISVAPQFQRKGIGSRLVMEGIRQAKELGHKSIVVLGYPGFYARFGFKQADSFGIKSPFAVSSESFMAIELAADALKDVVGTVEYPQAYYDICK